MDLSVDAPWKPKWSRLKLLNGAGVGRMMHEAVIASCTFRGQLWSGKSLSVYYCLVRLE